MSVVSNGDMVTYLGDGDSFYFSGGIELKPNDSFKLCLGSSSHRSGYLTNDFSCDHVLMPNQTTHGHPRNGFWKNFGCDFFY